MERAEDLRQRGRRERQIIERLRTAAVHLADAHVERTWAIVSAHHQGLSIRQIAAATGLSSTRVHQLLTSADAQEIPVWLSELREQDWSSSVPPVHDQPGPDAGFGSQVAAEVVALRQCLDWLRQAEHGERVVINLRADTDTETEFIGVDRPRLLRILERIAADLNDLAQAARGGVRRAATSERDPQIDHRRRLAEPPPQPRRGSQREERAVLRAAAGLPPE